MNIAKLRRLYGDEKLHRRRGDGRKRALDTRRPMLVAIGPPALDFHFVSDTSPMPVVSAC